MSPFKSVLRRHMIVGHQRGWLTEPYKRANLTLWHTRRWWRYTIVWGEVEWTLWQTGWMGWVLWCTTLGWVDQHVTKCSRAATLALMQSRLPLIYIKRGRVAVRYLHRPVNSVWFIYMKCPMHLHEWGPLTWPTVGVNVIYTICWKLFHPNKRRNCSHVYFAMKNNQNTNVLSEEKVLSVPELLLEERQKGFRQLQLDLKPQILLLVNMSHNNFGRPLL